MKTNAQQQHGEIGRLRAALAAAGADADALRDEVAKKAKEVANLVRQLDAEHAKQREIAAAADKAIKSHLAKVKLLEAEKRLMAGRDEENRKAAAQRQLEGHAQDRRRQGIAAELEVWQEKAHMYESALEAKPVEIPRNTLFSDRTHCIGTAAARVLILCAVLCGFLTGST